MNWLLIALGCVLLCILLIVIVGFFLSPSHTASRKAHFKRSPAEVFDVIADVASAPSWRPDLEAVELLSPREGKPSFREKGRFGPLVFVIDEKVVPERFVARIVDNPSFGGTWTYEVRPEPAGCVVAITERGEIRNPIFRFMSRYLFSQTATMEAYLRALGKKLGEDVTPEA